MAATLCNCTEMMAPHNNEPGPHRHGTIATTLTNPGIVDRLERDIADYLSPFGFRLQRARKTAVDCGAAVLEAPRPPDEPIGTLHLHVRHESLLSTVGPLLRTYLRLSPSHTHPLRYRAVVHCDFVLDALEKFERMSSEQKQKQLQRQEEASARRMAHHVHMLVRNSMGSALCMELIVIFPCYRKRKMQQDGPVGAPVPLTVDSVQEAMRNGPEANYYPSVQLVQQGENGAEEAEDGGNAICSNAFLHLEVKTRMCTVRHQPVLFRWLSSLQFSQTNCEGSNTSRTEGMGAATDNQLAIPEPPRSAMNTIPLVVACIEKVGNLHRILMLCHDYGRGKSPLETSLLSNAVVVLPNANGELYGQKQESKKGKEGKSKTLRDFEDAVDHFHKTILSLDSDADDEAYMRYRPTFVYEDDAREMIHHMVKQRQATSAQASKTLHQCMVAIDLHTDALTLCGDYATTESEALARMRSSDAIIFGYESTGIPQALADDLTDWVAIPSRSSINVVAAMSIILDALMSSDARDR